MTTLLPWQVYPLRPWIGGGAVHVGFNTPTPTAHQGGAGLRPVVRYDYDELVWYVDVGGRRSWARGSWHPVVDVAFLLARTPGHQLGAYLTPLRAEQ